MNEFLLLAPQVKIVISIHIKIWGLFLSAGYLSSTHIVGKLDSSGVLEIARHTASQPIQSSEVYILLNPCFSPLENAGVLISQRTRRETKFSQICQEHQAVGYLISVTNVNFLLLIFGTHLKYAYVLSDFSSHFFTMFLSELKSS